jgi:Spy/CpxP family protein refolding chaperone
MARERRERSLNRLHGHMDMPRTAGNNMFLPHRPLMNGDAMERGIAPGGTWWRNPQTIQRLGLTAEQQKRMDDALLASKVQLIHMHASLEEEELLLEPLLQANPLDQKKVMDQVTKIADTRADLEKANAKMLLDVRSVLTADQWTKLRDEQHGRDHSSLFTPGMSWNSLRPDGLDRLHGLDDLQSRLPELHAELERNLAALPDLKLQMQNSLISLQDASKRLNSTQDNMPDLKQKLEEARKQMDHSRAELQQQIDAAVQPR